MQCPFNPFPQIITRRLCLREINDGDEYGYFESRSDAEVAKILCRDVYTSLEDGIQRVKYLKQDVEDEKSISWVLSPINSDDFLGSVCLWNFSHEQNKAEIGYELLQQYRGQGYMREAVAAVLDFGFNKMRLSRIDAYPPKNNPKSINLLEAVGFNRIGDLSEEGANGSIMHMWVYIYNKTENE